MEWNGCHLLFGFQLSALSYQLGADGCLLTADPFFGDSTHVLS
jgi:hypothetical protein